MTSAPFFLTNSNNLLNVKLFEELVDDYVSTVDHVSFCAQPEPSKIKKLNRSLDVMKARLALSKANDALSVLESDKVGIPLTQVTAIGSVRGWLRNTPGT